MTSSGENGALRSVLDLERALEAAQSTAVDVEARLEESRREADAVLDAARENASRRAAERQNALAEAAEAEARASADAAEAAAAELHIKVAEIEQAFIAAASALVLPAGTQAGT